jgi:16S rRNA processing protein RimM
MTNKDKKIHNICVGQFVSAHGVRGLVKIRSFTAEPEALFDYAPLLSEDGKQVYKITRKSIAKDCFIASMVGIADKDAADRLRGDKIYVSRDTLPKTRKGEFYQADLVGLTAVDVDGKNYGKIMDIHDHGAGVFLEIGVTKKDSFMLPFKDAFVPTVDLKAGRVIIEVPEGWL